MFFRFAVLESGTGLFEFWRLAFRKRAIHQTSNMSSSPNRQGPLFYKPTVRKKSSAFGTRLNMNYERTDSIIHASIPLLLCES